MNLRNAERKKQGHCYSKREVAATTLLFLNNDEPVFVTLLFFRSIVWIWFFQGHKPTHDFKTRIVGADWLGDREELRHTSCYK